MENKITEAKNLGVSTNGGKELLISIKNDLLSHLKKEDENLYPRLHEIGSKDPEVKKVLDTYAKDMDLISASALHFFDHYSHKSSGFDFFKYIGSLVAVIKERIRKEELVLYPIYNPNL